MAPEQLLCTFSKALPTLHWRNATHTPEESAGPVVTTQVSPVLSLVGWESDQRFVVIVLNPDNEIVGTGVNNVPQGAIKSALYEGCQWISTQILSLAHAQGLAIPANSAAS